MRDGIEASFEIETVPQDYVQETRVGFWFLGALTWEKQVVEVALKDWCSVTRPCITWYGRKRR
jgi:hypothetical protein